MIPCAWCGVMWCSPLRLIQEQLGEVQILETKKIGYIALWIVWFMLLVEAHFDLRYTELGELSERRHRPRLNRRQLGIRTANEVAHGLKSQ